MNHFSYKLTDGLERNVQLNLEQWEQGDKVQALWKKDSSLWTNSGEGKAMGWLDVVQDELKKTDELRQFAERIRTDAFRHVVLLGMGGSSLGAEVMQKTFGASGVSRGYPEFHILDSTDPEQIKELESKINIEQTLFLVSSKSGSTLEPNIFCDYFYDKVRLKVSAAKAGRHFVAITDPGTSLEKRAKELDFCRIFHGVPTIGGRYSVLSHFGMLPAALMGVHLQRFLDGALAMVRACREASAAERNPGVLLGAILGESAKEGRDKLTIICSREIEDLGAWLEQLVAESTGKQGKGLIPIDREPLSSPENYGKDRLFVSLCVSGAQDELLESQLQKLEEARFPVIRIVLDDLYSLAQEFFRWEFAISVVGEILRINPFDQPDVEASKVATRMLTKEFEEKGEMPEHVPVFQNDHLQIFPGSGSLRSTSQKNFDASDYIREYLEQIREGDYFAVLAYMPMGSSEVKSLQNIRRQVLESKKVATCLEFGPRFLHSTGQAYKGGPDSGVFIQITTDDPAEFRDMRIPGHSYNFSVVKSAEAQGDFDVLTQKKRRAMRIHIRGDRRKGLELIRAEFKKAVA